MTKLMEKYKAEIIASVEGKLDEVVSEISKLTSRINDLEQKVFQIESRCTKAEKASEKLYSSIIQEIEDRNNRRLNLIVSGVSEEDGSVEERKAADRTKIETLLHDLDGDWNGGMSMIAHMHRVGNRVSKGPRLIRIICSEESTKKGILRKAKQLRNIPAHSNIYINPDLTVRQREESKRLRNELKSRRSQGENVVIRNGKVVSNNNENFH